MENDNNNRDFNFAINVSGLQAPTGAGGSSLPEGFYRAKVDDMYIKDDKPNRVIIKLSIAEGEFSGVLRTDGLNIPKSDNDNVRYYWRGLAESAGYTSAQLDAGAIQIGPSAFVGKTVHIHFRPKEEGNAERQYERITYLAPSTWAQQQQNAAMKSGRAAQASGAAALGGADVNANLASAPATTSRNEVLNSLGLG